MDRRRSGPPACCSFRWPCCAVISTHNTKNRIQPCRIGVIPLCRNEIRLASRGDRIMQAPTDHSFSIFCGWGGGGAIQNGKNRNKYPILGSNDLYGNAFRQKSPPLSKQHKCVCASLPVRNGAKRFSQPTMSKSHRTVWKWECARAYSRGAPITNYFTADNKEQSCHAAMRKGIGVHGADLNRTLTRAPHQCRHGPVRGTQEKSETGRL